MNSTRPRCSARGLARASVGAVLALVAAVAVPATAAASVTTFGASFSHMPTTIDTASGLGYAGTNVAVPVAPTAPTGFVHINHDGADTALWNETLAGGASAAAPAAGQITSVSLEGCAEQAGPGPAPLTQIHFQDLAPLSAGGAKVNVTTQPFNIPICGAPAGGGGVVNGFTVTTYQPQAFCVNEGDYVAFNDEGGFNSSYYPSGVPYMVMADASRAITDSFVRNDGTGNGATMSSTDTTNHDGFAANGGQELMLSATLATGPDATPLCPGGTRGAMAPPPPPPGALGGPPAVGLGPQRDGVDEARYVGLALYCNTQGTPCTGSVTLTYAGANTASVDVLATSTLNMPAQTPGHVQVRVTPQAMSLMRQDHGTLTATMTVHLNTGPTYSQAVTIWI